MELQLGQYETGIHLRDDLDVLQLLLLEIEIANLLLGAEGLELVDLLSHFIPLGLAWLVASMVSTELQALVIA